MIVALRDLALAAGREIMRIYGAGFTARAKADASPVTDADEAAERIILEGLARIAPDVPVVAEEQVAAGRAPQSPGARFFLVDPLDGTKEFVARNGEFTVNIARIEDGRPVAGVVHAPAVGETYWADVSGAHAGDGRKIAARMPPGEGLVALVSRSHGNAETEAWLAAEPIAARKTAGSSLKFCHIAAGLGDVYPRIGRTMEWDTAAGQAILEAAGGSVRDLAGRPLAYGKPGFVNPSYVARGKDRP